MGIWNFLRTPQSQTYLVSVGWLKNCSLYGSWLIMKFKTSKRETSEIDMNVWLCLAIAWNGSGSSENSSRFSTRATFFFLLHHYNVGLYRRAMNSSCAECGAVNSIIKNCWELLKNLFRLLHKSTSRTWKQLMKFRVKRRLLFCLFSCVTFTNLAGYFCCES